MARILVVEDSARLAYGLRNNLEIDGHEVAVAEDGSRGLESAVSWRPDLVILDLMLPKMTGYEVLRALRERGFEIPVLILSARGEEVDKVMGFRLGADDYVTKPFGVLELLARVSAILRRSGTTGQAVQVETFGSIEIRLEHRCVLRDGREVRLTPKEFDLLVALVRRRGAAATRVDLMTEVWGDPAAVLSRTVDTHIAELRRKLEERPGEPRHILTVHRYGYRLRV
ncbi:MAG: response regulator transcription factor [Gemmatimonadota bacterium]|nr:response regulator transcription factor [Gemmatimonadota bacterium]MDE2983254.1 response regulator transcription factor [Gemmatimonadota bacterium]